MKAFPVSNLESDYYFTKRAYLDDKYIILTPETPVTSKLIERLKRWRISQVYSNGSLVDAPTASQPVPTEGTALSIDQDIQEQKQFAEAQAFYADLASFVERMFTTFVTRNELAERPISEIVKRTIEMVKSHRRHILRLAELNAPAKNYIVNHSAKATILSVAVGAAIHLPPFKLIELGTAALLHEIGMIRLPPSLYMSDNQLTDQERRAITAHTVLGFKILRQYSFPMTVSLAVLECRENVDGTGYPRKLTGDKISTYAKVIMVSGSYAALTSNRPFRDAVEGHDAVVDMLKQRSRMYDETVLRALISSISIFPLGSCVELANGTRGIVVDNEPSTPRAPTVRVIAGPKGEPYAEQQIVDTGAIDELRIRRAIPCDEVRSTPETSESP